MLTLDNYFSDDAGKEYLSNSQFKAFQKCEFSAHAQYVTGEYKRPVTDALLIGSYVDSYFSGEFENWIEKNKSEIQTKAGKNRAPFINADNMIKRIEQDELFLSCMRGLKQQVLTPVIGGVKWKCLPDFVDVNLSICYDLKTTKSFSLDWNDKHKKKLPFYESFNYFLQLAIYREALKQKYDKVFAMAICAVTKEATPDIKILSFESDECLERFDREIKNVLEYQETIVKIKKGEFTGKLTRCEECEWCKKTKKLDTFEEAQVIL